MYKIKRILNWFPVLVWYGFIFFLSSIPGSTISSIPSLILKFTSSLGLPLAQLPLEFYQFWGHRIAHFVEYGILGILVVMAYSKENVKITVMTILFLAVFIFLSGALDEWHQSFVPGRTPALIDVIFDTICGTFGMLIYHMGTAKVNNEKF